MTQKGLVVADAGFDPSESKGGGMMKKLTAVLGVSLFLGLGAWFSSAQEAPEKALKARRKAPSIEEKHERQMKLLAYRLELDEKQEKEIGKILLDKEKKLEKLAKQIRSIEAAANEKVRGVLKLEQRDAFEEMRVMMKRGRGGPQRQGSQSQGPRFAQRPGGMRGGMGRGQRGGMQGGEQRGFRGGRGGGQRGGQGGGQRGFRGGQHRPPMGPGQQFPPDFDDAGPGAGLDE